MKLTKRKEVLISEISLDFCKIYFQQTVKHFKNISNEISDAILKWLVEDPHSTINTVDFDLQVREFYNHDGARERTWVYWTRRGWSEIEAKEKVTALQGATRKQNIARLTKELGSAEIALQAVKDRDRKASHRCIEFWQMQGLDDAAASSKVFESQYRVPTIETKEKFKRTSKRSVEYWMSSGLSKEEALAKVTERQSTFSLEKCIEKYGEDNGYNVWLKRQEQWQNTLLSKPLEEQERINQAKMSSRTGVSSKGLYTFV
jgi:predicted CoA-binding protein